MKTSAIAAAIAVCLASLVSANADEPQKLEIGMIVTLSGPGAVLGQQARDGFRLALDQRGGKLGGREAELVVVDDELKPDVAAGLARKLVESDKVDFVVGPARRSAAQPASRVAARSALARSPVRRSRGHAIEWAGLRLASSQPS